MSDKIIMRTLRYCCFCKKNTYFQYNPLIEHSRCTQCQQSYSLPINDLKNYKQQIINIIKKRIQELKIRGNKQRTDEAEYIIKKIEETQYREP